MTNINHRIYSERSVKDEESRIMTFIASDGTRDSYGTVLNPDGWDLSRFEGNPIIGYQHDIYLSADPDNVIGTGRAYVEDGKLKVDISFEPADLNERADKIWRKLLFGSLNAVSVGFEEIGRGEFGQGDEGPTGKNPTYYFKGQRLLEVSVVNIPANPNALKDAMSPEKDRIEQLRQEAEAAAEEEAEKARAEAAQAAAEAEKDKTIIIAEAALHI